MGRFGPFRPLVQFWSSLAILGNFERSSWLSFSSRCWRCWNKKCRCNFWRRQIMRTPCWTQYFFSWTQYIKVAFCNPNQVQPLHQFSENHQNLLTHWKSFWWKITLLEQTETAPPGDISPRQWPLFKQMSYRGTKLVGILRPGGQLKKNHTDLCGNSTRGGRDFFLHAGLYNIEYLGLYNGK